MCADREALGLVYGQGGLWEGAVVPLAAHGQPEGVAALAGRAEGRGVDGASQRHLRPVGCGWAPGWGRHGARGLHPASGGRGARFPGGCCFGLRLGLGLCSGHLRRGRGRWALKGGGKGSSPAGWDLGPRRDRWNEAEGGVDRCGMDEDRAGVEAGDCGEPEDAQREDPHGTNLGPGEGAGAPCTATWLRTYRSGGGERLAAERDGPGLLLPVYRVGRAGGSRL